MVQVLKRRPVTVFRVFDREGRAIGDVVQPKSAPVMERGAGTVLLVRGLLTSQDPFLGVQ
jgi:hypothetical protein